LYQLLGKLAIIGVFAALNLAMGILVAVESQDLRVGEST